MSECEMWGVCDVCGRRARVEWHCASRNCVGLGECSVAGGQGWVLCVEVCHPTAHELMGTELVGGSAMFAVVVMMSRLSRRIPRFDGEGCEEGKRL